MITREDIAAETANELNPTEQALWLTLFRSYSSFDTASYPDAAAKLEAVEGVPAKQLLAALRKIEELGADTTKLEGGRSAINYDPVRDRQALIAYALSVLYESQSSATGMTPFIFVSDTCPS